MKDDYSIQFVSQATGINSHTIRAWEKRYKTVAPKRDDKGRRVYTKDDIYRLKIIKELSAVGNDLKTLGQTKTDILKLKYKDIFGFDFENKRVDVKKIDFNSLLQNLIMALKFYKLDAISHELEKITSEHNLREFSLSLLSPLLQEVGAMCATKEISIAQEHALSALLKFHVGNLLFDYARINYTKNETIIIAAPDQELHEFGILASALLCKHYGIKFYYLGSNLPVESLIQCCEQIKPSRVILGISKSMESTNPRHINEYISQLNRALTNTKLMIGGYSQIPAQLKNSEIQFIPTLNMLDFELSKI